MRGAVACVGHIAVFAREGQSGGRGRWSRRASTGLGLAGNVGLEVCWHVTRRRQRGAAPGIRGRRGAPWWQRMGRRRLGVAVTSCLSWAALWGNFTTLLGRRRDGELRTSRGSSREQIRKWDDVAAGLSTPSSSKDEAEKKNPLPIFCLAEISVPARGKALFSLKSVASLPQEVTIDAKRLKGERRRERELE
jgi:hypothetical protein